MNERSPLAAVLTCAVAALGSAAAAQPIPPSRASLAALTQVADIEALALSPDGRSVAFRVQRPSIARNTYAIEWYVAVLATGAVRRVADGGEVIYDNGEIEFEPPIWAPDGRVFFRRAMMGGAIGIWRTAADGSASIQVVSGDANVESMAKGDDGRSLTFVTGPTRQAVEAAERAEYDDGILIDASVDTQQGLYRPAYAHGRLGSQRLTGHWVSRDGLLWREPRTRHRFDTATLKMGEDEPVRAATAPAPAIADTMTATSAAGGLATANAGTMGDVPSLSVVTLAGSKVDCLTSACRDGQIAAIAWRQDRAELLVTQQGPTFRQSLYLFDPAKRSIRRVYAGQGLVSGGRDGRTPCAVSARFAVCVEASAVGPPQLIRIDLDEGRSAVLYDPNARLRDRSAPEVRDIEVPIGNGRTVAGVVMTPPHASNERLPLFVMYYYCPGFLRGGMGDEFPFGPLVDAGFAVACLNYVARKPADTAIDQYENAQASVEAVIDLLDRRGLIDPKRVGMGGLSFGSEVTMWMVMKTDRLAAAAVSSPQPSPTGYWMRAIRGRDTAEQYRSWWKAGSPDEDSAGWRRISPELNIERIKVPLLMQLPEQEYVPALPLYARLTLTPTPVELYAFPNESHTKLQPRHRFAVYRRYLDWFRFWLQDYCDPDPGAQFQYRRWEALRSRRSSNPGGNAKR